MGYKFCKEDLERLKEKASCTDLNCYSKSIEECIKLHPENVVVHWSDLK